MVRVFRGCCRSCLFLLLLGAVPGRAEQTSTIRLSPDEVTVCAVNEDANSVCIWNWRGDGGVRQIAVGREPRTLAFSPDGRYLYVANQSSQTLSVVAMEAGKTVQEIALGGQPYGVLVSPDGSRAFVSQYAGGYTDGVYHPGLITVLDLRSYQPVGQIPVQSRPWAMATNAAGDALYVTHYLNLDGKGIVTEIDLQRQRVVREIGLCEDEHVRDGRGGVFNALAAIALHPSRPRALVAGMHANVRRGTSLNGQALSHKTTVQAAVRVIDLAAGQEIDDARILSSFNGQAVAVPAAVGFLGGSDCYIDVYFASNDFKVIEYNERGVVAERALRSLPAGPTGLAVTRDGATAFFSSRWDRCLSQFSFTDPHEPTLVKTVPACAEPWDAERVKGAKLFHNTRDTRMTANRWMSCAVCHLDAGVISDGLVWDLTLPGAQIKVGNTMDLVNTPEASPPFFHRGTADSIPALEQFVLSIQQGSGFLAKSADSSASSPEWNAMQQYMNALWARPNPHMDGPRPRAEIRAASERGARLFSDATVGCSHCHQGPSLRVAGRGGDRRVFDVGTGGVVKTPSLAHLWDTAPYLHDGRAATLHDVLVTHNPQDRHGRTSHLEPEELHDLETFLLAPCTGEKP